MQWNDTDEYDGDVVGGLLDAGRDNRADIYNALDHHAAMTHHAALPNYAYGEYQETGNVMDLLMANRQASANLGELYANYADGEAPAEVAKNDVKLDLSSPEARLESLARITQETQFGEGDVQSRFDCAASSFVAAAILGGGTDGLIKLMDGMDKDAFGGEVAAKLEKEGGQMYELRKKIEKGEALTMDDIHHLQKSLDTQLRHDDKLLGHGDGEHYNTGVSHDVEQLFLNQAGDFHAMMIANKLGLDGIDTDGDGDSNHAVLQIGDKAIYDPSMRKGGQLVTQREDLRDYELLTRATVR